MNSEMVVQNVAGDCFWSILNKMPRTM